MRDEWWALVADRNKKLLDSEEISNEVALLQEEPENVNLLKKKNTVAIYHCIYSDEDFETSAKILFNLVLSAQREKPNLKRVLFLDIEGHRNKKGGFDHDMFELQMHFILRFLMDYLKEVRMPLFAVKNKKRQKNDLPQYFSIVVGSIDLKQIPNDVDQIAIYHADSGKWLKSQE